MDDQLLVDFERPPIAEVVAAVGFDDLPDGSLAHFGAFWKSELEAHFPRVQEKAPYQMPVERFGSAALVPQIQLSISDYVSPRLWFLNSGGDELLQIQRNWFACNWRKVTSDAYYSHWPNRQASFLKWFSAFESYVQKSSLGPLKVNQCEVTYINHVALGADTDPHSKLNNILRTIGEPELRTSLALERTVLNQQYLVRGPDERTIGRMHFSAQPAFLAATREAIYILEFTVRGVPAGQTQADLIEFFRISRAAIVNTFADITTDEMQREWGIRDRRL